MNRSILFFLLLLLFSSCNDVPKANDQSMNLPSSSVESTLTPTAIPTSTPAMTPTIVFINNICSPLKDVSLKELPQIVTQPFQMPRPGHDDGHHGVDFSYYRWKEYIGIQGLPVFSILNGKVIAVLSEKFVYGNTVIIETPIEHIPQSWLSVIQIPPILPTVVPDARLNCPDEENDPNKTLTLNKRSIYILYAHLNKIPSLQIGENIICSQKIGEVGNSGDSTNPHLHVETRIGPSGAIFESMAHYDNHATIVEMHNYCVWRVSGLFQPINPMILLNLKIE